MLSSTVVSHQRMISSEAYAQVSTMGATHVCPAQDIQNNA